MAMRGKLRARAFLLGAAFALCSPAFAAAPAAKTTAKPAPPAATPAPNIDLSKISALRLSCEGAAKDAEVYINSEFKGECPVDIEVPAGILQLYVTKKVDALHEAVSEQEMRIGEGVIKRVEITLGAPRLTAEGKILEGQRLKREAAAKGSERAAKLAADLAAMPGLTSRQRADHYLTKAMAAGDPDSIELTRMAQESDPTYPAPAQLLVSLTAFGSDGEALRTIIKEGFQSTHVAAEDIARLPKLDTWLRQPEFVAFVSELVGAEGLQIVRAGATAQGRQVIVSRMLGNNAMLFVGTNKSETGYRTFSRRKITAAESLITATDGCATEVALGEVAGISEDMESRVTLKSRIVAWRDVKTMTVRDRTVDVEGLWTEDGWLVAAFNLPTQYATRRLADAVESIIAACNAR